MSRATVVILLCGLVLLPACGRGAKGVAGPTARAETAWLASADLVGIQGRTVIGLAIQEGGVAEVGRVTLPVPEEPPSARVPPVTVTRSEQEPYEVDVDADPAGGLLPTAGWADRDHLVVRDGRRHVVVLSSGEAKALPVPTSAEFLAVPLSADDADEYGNDEEYVRGPIGAREHALVVAPGEAWWRECVIYPIVDERSCLHRVARLWPEPGSPIPWTRIAPRTWDWPEVKPDGHALGFLPDGAAPGGNENPAEAVRCTTPAGGAAVELRSGSEDQDLVIDARWVSAAPPRLLVQYGHRMMYDDAVDSWRLHEGCGPEPIATGTSVQVGPSGLWIGVEASGPVLRRGGEVIGKLPGGAEFQFRPPAPVDARTLP